MFQNESSFQTTIIFQIEHDKLGNLYSFSCESPVHSLINFRPNYFRLLIKSNSIEHSTFLVLDGSICTWWNPYSSRISDFFKRYNAQIKTLVKEYVKRSGEYEFREYCSNDHSKNDFSPRGDASRSVSGAVVGAVVGGSLFGGGEAIAGAIAGGTLLGNSKNDTKNNLVEVTTTEDNVLYPASEYNDKCSTSNWLPQYPVSYHSRSESLR